MLSLLPPSSLSGFSAQGSQFPSISLPGVLPSSQGSQFPSVDGVFTLSAISSLSTAASASFFVASTKLVLPGYLIL